MISTSRIIFAICATSMFLVPVLSRAAISNNPRMEVAADAGWKFFLGDPAGAEAASFSDTSCPVSEMSEIDGPFGGLLLSGQKVAHCELLNSQLRSNHKAGTSYGRRGRSPVGKIPA